MQRVQSVVESLIQAINEGTYPLGTKLPNEYELMAALSVSRSTLREATLPNFVIHEEHNANHMKVFRDFGKYEYVPVNGYYEVPELPGIGQEMSEEAMATSKKVVVS